MADDALNEMKKAIRLARRAPALSRETLLLKALSHLFDDHVVTEADWRHASPEMGAAWRGQMERLLDALLFAAASAEAYSGEQGRLSKRVEECQDHITDAHRRIADLEMTAVKLRRELAVENQRMEELEKTVCLLNDLKNALPLWMAAREALGPQRLHAMANAGIAPAMTKNRERLMALRDRIDALLAEQDQLLKESVMEKEKEWERIGKALSIP